MEKNDKSNLQKMYDYQEVAGKGYYDYVVRGAKVVCNYGSSSCVLNLINRNGIYTADEKQLITSNDYKSENVKGFGMCKKNKNNWCKCKPELREWSDVVNINLIISNEDAKKPGRAVTQNATTICSKGGIVSFQTSGQNTPSYKNKYIKGAVEIVEDEKGSWRRGRDRKDFIGHVRVRNSGLYNFGIEFYNNTIIEVPGFIFVYEHIRGEACCIGEYEIKKHDIIREDRFPEEILYIDIDSHESKTVAYHWKYWIDIKLYANRDYYFEIDCKRENAFDYKLIGNQDKIISNDIGLVQWTLPYSCENWFAANTGLATVKRYIVYLDEAYAYIFQKALEDEQFIKERKDELKDTIQGAIKTVAITAAGIAETVTGVYLTAIDFMLTIFVESERDILIKQLSEYNSAIGWGGKLLRIIIYEDNRYMSISDIYNGGRKTEVSWYGKLNKPGDTYIVYGEKYMWGEIKRLKEKSDDLIKAAKKFKKEGESVRNIIKSYNFSE